MGTGINEVLKSLDLDQAVKLFVPDFKDNFLPTLHDADLLRADPVSRRPPVLSAFVPQYRGGVS
jgi:hypothetical protein